MIPQRSGPRQERSQDRAIQGNNISCNWGDDIDKINKSNDVFRIGFQNVNGFLNGENEDKAESLKDTMDKYKIDIFGMVEMNTNWRLVPKNRTIRKLTQGWYQHQRVNTAYNQRDSICNIHQPGGTAIFSRDEMALRHINAGSDTKNLGRWVWSRYRGKDGMVLRQLSVYVPNLAMSQGHKKVYNQQKQALLAMGITTSVMEIFWNDFWQLIDEAIEAGEQLIISGDWNLDVRKDLFLDQFKQRNISPIVTGNHGTEGPGTFSGGNKPIDEIMASDTLAISSSGYIAQGEGLGDHCIIWADITKRSAVGAKMPPTTKFQGRKLKCNDPRVIDRYNNKYKEHISKHGYYARAADLFFEVHEEMTQEQTTEYEKLDDIREKAMHLAEQKCRKIRRNGVSTSPLIKQARRKIKYITNTISRLKGNNVHARTLIRQSNQLNYSTEGKSIQELNQELKMAYKTYNTTKKQHKQLRKNFLLDLADALAERGKAKKSTIVRNLIKLEDQREMFRKLKYITKNDSNLGTTFITIKNDDGTKTDLTEKREIEEALIRENRQKYHQTENTNPFFREPLRSDLGDLADGPRVQDVIQGTYQPQGEIDEYTRDFLEVCKQKHTIPNTNLHRSPAVFRDSWKKMDERTGSRALHFGHFKAACHHEQNIITHFIMAEIPFRTGYSPKRWQNATNLMILKKAGLYDIDRLRTIVLFEADFNHNNKYYGKAMMDHVIKHGALAKEQYSIPGRKAIDHALNRRLLFDIQRYSKTSLAMTSCDLKSCYDRIAHTPAILAALGYGVNGKPAYSMLSTFQNCQFFTKTAYGEANQSFGGQEEGYIAKPQGFGQGNGSGPSSWAVVSSRMFEVLHKRKLATSITTPITKQQLELVGFAFVDDSDIIASGGFNNDPDATITNMQDAIDCWEGVAKSTGGALEPSKSWWYLIFFQWDENGEWRYGTEDELVGQDTLTAKDRNDNRVELNHLKPSEAQEMLGVFLAPDGNNQRQIAKMKTKASQFGEKIRAGHVEKHQAWLAMTLMATKSLEYPLPALTLSEKECTEIMWPLLKNILPKSGLVRTIKRDLLYGPTSLQGLGIKNLYLIQGLSHIYNIIEHTWKETITGHFINTSLQMLRLEIGENGPIFQKAYKDFEPHILTESWVQDTWRFASEQDLSFDDKTPNLPLLREGDQTIMWQLKQTAPKKEWKAINQCRLYLRVFSLAEITTGDGRHWHRDAIDGKRRITQTREQLNWPRWERPRETYWTTWRRALKRLCIGNSVYGRLRNTLGQWYYNMSDTWKWYIQGDEEKLWEKTNDNQWLCHNRLGRHTRQKRFKLEISRNQPAPNVHEIFPTTVLVKPTELNTEGDNIWIPNAPTLPLFHQAPTNNNYKQQWLHFSVTQSSSIDKIIRELRQGKGVICVSDGSYRESTGKGTAAWIIECSDRTQFIKGISLVPGPKDINNSYRSESVGILAILEQLHIICQRYNIQNGGCIVGCDGIEALKQSTHGHTEWVVLTSKQVDILSACTKLVKHLPLRITARHVKGHQDDHTTIEKLDRMSQLNIKMDTSAKHGLDLFEKSQVNLDIYESHPFSFTPVYFKNNTPIYHDFKNYSYEIIMKQKLHEYWISRNRYTENTQSLICWTAVNQATNNTTLGRRRFIAKWSSGAIAVGKNALRWKLRPRNNCPYCNQPNETTQHILECQHPNAIENWNNCLNTFKQDLQALDTCPYLTAAIIIGLKSLKSNTTQQQPLHYFTTDLQEAIIQQSQIGWKSLLEGLLATAFVNYQQTYYDDSSSRKTGRSWAHKTIRKLWNFLFDLWEHRNNQLHNTEKIEELQGLQELKSAIRAEWRIGLNRLPAYDFSYLFNISENELLKKSAESLRNWLSIIRNGRYLHQDPRLLHDQFSTDTALNKWVDLRYYKKDGMILEHEN